MIYASYCYSRISVLCYPLGKICRLSFKKIISDNAVKRNSYPHSIAVGHLNNDSWVDIVAVYSGTNNIGIFFGSGNTTFSSPETYSTGDNSRPFSVVLHDFNNDTYLDIAVANSDTHNVRIFFGDGNGIFSNQTTISTGSSRPISLAVGDFNNDHRLDIVVTNNGTHNIGILLGYANGSFGNQVTYNTGYDSFPYSVVVGDFNNDNQLDIGVTNYGTNNIGIFLGYGNGTFTAQLIYSTGSRSNPYSLAIGDFNGDNQLDIAVANTGVNSVGIFLGHGNGSFASQKTYSITPASNLYGIAVGDFDKDNQLDVAVSNYDTNNVSIFLGYGNGDFAAPTFHSSGAESGPFGIAVGDFDNNNQSDIAVVNSNTNNVLVLIGYNIKQSQNPTVYSTGSGSYPFCAVTNDMNNDNELDLIVANYGTDCVGVFLGNGNGSFAEQIVFATGNGSHPYAITVNDMDNDNQLDIIVGNSKTESLGILFGYGNATFTSIMKFFTGSFSSLISVIVADFNNDSQPDIAFADYGTNKLGILFGYGNRTVGNLTTYSTGDGSRTACVATGDFNNDGRLDIAVANVGANNIFIFMGSGDGTFSLFIIYSTGDLSGPKRIFTADINKDNQVDLIVPNNDANNVDIWYGFGNGSFAKQRTYSTGPGSTPRWVSIVDINNDSWLDLVVVELNFNSIGVFLADGQGSFGNQTIYSSSTNGRPTTTAVGDFNKDNLLDIAVTNVGANNIAVLLGHHRKGSGTQINCATNFRLPSNSANADGVNNENHLNSINANCISNMTPVLLGNSYADFNNQKPYSTGSSSSPYSIAFDDFNNDNRMDFAVTYSGNENIGVFLGYNNETFPVEMKYSLGVGSNPHHIIAHDFNKDDQLDIAVADHRTDSISVFIGYGNGSFSEGVKYSTGSGSKPKSLAVGDLDNDDRLDLIVANEGTSTIGVFFGSDYTSFEEQSPCSTGNTSSPNSIAVGDFNNDGQLDIVFGNYQSNNIGVFLSYGNGSFTSFMTYSNVPASHPWAVAVGDLNNDNNLDITVANWGLDQVGIVLGYGNGSFGMPTLYSTESGSHPVAIGVGDFDNDNNSDITVANWGTGNIGVFFGYGNGTFKDMVTLSTGKDSAPTSISIADVNNDTQLDIIVANEVANSMGIFLGYGNGSFANQMAYSTGSSSAPYCTAIGDFNNDNHLDIAVVNFNTDNLAVFFGYGDGTFGNLKMYTTGVGSGPAYVKIGDFNKDSQLDLVVANANNGNVGFFFGFKDGTFTSMAVVPLMGDSNPRCVVVGDFNNDSRLDLAVVVPTTNSIRILLAHGSKPFGGQTSFSIGDNSRPSSVVVGHFNHDNLLDIAVTNYATSNLGIFLGYGNKIFSNITTYPTGDHSHPSALTVGNFDNDSFTDIVVVNSNTNTFTVFAGLDNGTFTILATYSTGQASEPSAVAVGDFNRDHHQDIVVANFGTNNVGVFFGVGNGDFINPTWYPLEFNAQPNSIIFKDFNNDGWDDIAVVTYGTNNVQILWNTC